MKFFFTSILSNSVCLNRLYDSVVSLFTNASLRVFSMHSTKCVVNFAGVNVTVCILCLFFEAFETSLLKLYSWCIVTVCVLWLFLPHDAVGWSVVCDCGIS